MSGSRVCIVGGSIAGLGLALALERRGIDVEVHEADDLGSAEGPPSELARRTTRRTTPQAAHSHAFIARCHTLLTAEAPDVIDDLVGDGVEPIDLAAAQPAGVPAHAHHPDEEGLIVLPARRTTFEAALRRAVLRRPGIRLVTGHRAVGLLREASGAVTRVGGVLFDDESAATGDIIVDATGRRSQMPTWLLQDGVGFEEVDIDCGITYFTRFYRLLAGAEGLPLNRGYTSGGSFDRYSCLVFPGDDGSFSITFGTLPEDKALRGLLDGSSFDAAVRSIPSLAPWLDVDRAEPISEVRMMAGLTNRLRRPWVDGRPTVLGWTAVGDASATTNPAHSRGCSLSLVHAVGVADVIAAGGSPDELAAGFDRVREREQRPWVNDSIDQDRQRLERWRMEVGSPDPSHSAGRLTNGEAYGASFYDAYVWRRFTRLQQLLEYPDAVLGDRRVVARVRAVQASGVRLPQAEAPERDDLVGLLDRASA